MKPLFQNSRYLAVTVLFTVVVFLSYVLGCTLFLIPSLAALTLMDRRFSGLLSYKFVFFAVPMFVFGDMIAVLCPIPIAAKCVFAFVLALLYSGLFYVRRIGMKGSGTSSSFCLFFTPLVLLPLFVQKDYFERDSLAYLLIGFPLLLSACVFIDKRFPLMKDTEMKETQDEPSHIVILATVVIGAALLFVANFFPLQFLATPPLILAVLYFALNCKRYIRCKSFGTVSVLYQCVAAAVIGVICDGVVMFALGHFYYDNYGIVAAVGYAFFTLVAFFLFALVAGWQGRLFPPAVGILLFPFLRDPGAAYVGYTLAALSAAFCVVFLANGPIAGNDKVSKM